MIVRAESSLCPSTGCRLPHHLDNSSMFPMGTQPQSSLSFQSRLGKEMRNLGSFQEIKIVMVAMEHVSRALNTLSFDYYPLEGIGRRAGV